MRDLVDAIRGRNAILFVGAGVSKNLGLPSWGELVGHMAEELGYEREIFETLGNPYTLAEYYVLREGAIGPLRSYLDVEFHKNIDIKQSEIHRLIVGLDFPIIYTTNYDCWLERAFEAHGGPRGRAVRVVTEVRDLVGVREGEVQIVKFHGDFTDDSSIVLTESSYFERLGFEGPLDIKLRADTLGRTVLFIGYSMNDINTRYLIYKLNKLWSSSYSAKARPESYVFLARPNPVEALVLENRGITPIVSSCDHPGEGLRAFLSDLFERAYGEDAEERRP